MDGEQKTIVGNLGAIEKMLNLIESRYNRNICDEVMETAWSTMWNVTGKFNTHTHICMKRMHELTMSTFIIR